MQEWLTRRQGQAPADRLRARMLAALLVFMGLYHPLALVLSGWLTPWMRNPADAAPVVAVTVLIWACYLLLRRGYFNIAASIFPAVSLAAVGWYYLHWGLAMQTGTQLISLLPPLLGALLLGRWVVWLCGAVLVAIILGSGWADIARQFYDPSVLRSTVLVAARFAAAAVAAALLLDRAAALLDGYGRELAERNRQLARTRDRLQLEMEERERARRQLLHAQKVEATGWLASGIAHDFNHLLGLVLGYAQRGRQEQDVRQLHAMFEGVESAARRAAAASRRLLDFSRMEAPHPEVFDAAGLVDGLRPMLRHLFPETVEVRVDLPAQEQPVFFDPQQLELVLLNLASNAAEAMPGGGIFTLGVAAHGVDRVEIRASDTGRGMTAEEVARASEPFYTTKPAGQGTGLGLAIASDLAKRAGGELLIESAPGQGTTVTVRLPRRGAAG